MLNFNISALVFIDLPPQRKNYQLLYFQHFNFLTYILTFRPLFNISLKPYLQHPFRQFHWNSLLRKTGFSPCVAKPPIPDRVVRSLSQFHWNRSLSRIGMPELLHTPGKGRERRIVSFPHRCNSIGIIRLHPAFIPPTLHTPTQKSPTPFRHRTPSRSRKPQLL